MLLELSKGCVEPLGTGILLMPILFEDPSAACVEVGVAVVVTVTVAGDETEHDSVTVSAVDWVVV